MWLKSRSTASSGNRRPSPEGFLSARAWSTVLIALAVLMGITSIVVSAFRPLTSFENALLWFIALAAGIAGSFLGGLQSAKAAARDMMKPAAKSAFRRVLTLYASLERLGQSLDGEESGHDPAARLSIASAILREQLASASDAMEDWRDIVPDEVAEVERKLNLRSTPNRPQAAEIP